METGMYHTGPLTARDLLVQAINLLDDENAREAPHT